MPPRPLKETMSKVDTAWLRMEQPTNLMMITGVVVLDEGVTFETLVTTIKQRWLAFRRFRQKAVDRTRGAFWQLDEDFDIDAHVRKVALPGEAGRDELEEYVSDLASTQLDPSRPLWQFHYIENYQGGPAVVQRIHHCYADGIALIQVFLSLTDPTPEPRKSALDPVTWQQRRIAESNIFRRLTEPARDGFSQVWHWTQKLADEAMGVLAEPDKAGRYISEATELSKELVNSLALPNDPKTLFKGKLGVRKRVAWDRPLPLDEVKAVSKAFGVTVNDILIAAVSGALRSYMLEQGEVPTRSSEIRATVPVNLRPLEHAKNLGNHFGLVFLNLPIGESNPVDRVRQVNRRMNELKESRQATVSLGLLAALGMGPSALQKPALDLLSEKASTVLTNVPGPQQPLYMAGGEVKEMMFWVPQNGNLGLGISILSYNGKVFLGLISDRKLVPDQQEIIRRFQPEMENLLYLSLMLPVDQPDANLWARSLLQ